MAGVYLIGGPFSWDSRRVLLDQAQGYCWPQRMIDGEVFRQELSEPWIREAGGLGKHLIGPACLVAQQGRRLGEDSAARSLRRRLARGSNDHSTAW